MQGWKRSGALVLSLTILGLSMLQASGMGCSNAPDPVSADSPAANKSATAPPTTTAPAEAKSEPKPSAGPSKSPPSNPTTMVPDEGIMMGASKAPVFVRPKPTTSTSAAAPSPQAPTQANPLK